MLVSCSHVRSAGETACPLTMQFRYADKAESIDSTLLDVHWWKHMAFYGIGHVEFALVELRRAFQIPYMRKNYSKLMQIRKVSFSGSLVA